MGQVEYNPENISPLPDAKIAIIHSKWYGEISEKMIKKCLNVLEYAKAPQPEIHTLPGCVELPLAAKRLIQRDPQLEAIIAFGVVLKGDTYHFDMVCNACFRGFEQVSLEHDIPIINEVLAVDNIEDAEKRSADDDNNKGIEAALAAIEIIDWRRKHPISA